jgi:hypothetical protein
VKNLNKIKNKVYIWNFIKLFGKNKNKWLMVAEFLQKMLKYMKMSKEISKIIFWKINILKYFNKIKFLK